MAVVWERIQSHVYAVVKLKVLLTRTPRDQLDAIGRDALSFQQVKKRLTIAPFGTKEHQSRSLNPPENPRPELHDLLVDFAEVVQTAERNESCFHAGRRVYRGLDREGIVTP